MKCPRCWVEKAYLREVKGWKATLMACLLLRPMRCRHCYHKFTVSWFFTIGKQIHPPRPQIAAASSRKEQSPAAQNAPNECIPFERGRRPRKSRRTSRADAA